MNLIKKREHQKRNYNQTVWDFSAIFWMDFYWNQRKPIGSAMFYLFNWVFNVALNTLYRSYLVGRFSWGGGNQYIQLVFRFCTVNCRPSVRQVPLWPHRIRGLNCWPQRCEASVLPLIHGDPDLAMKYIPIKGPSSPYLKYPTTLRYVAERSWVLKVRTRGPVNMKKGEGGR